jgi:hypothetical protein
VALEGKVVIKVVVALLVVVEAEARKQSAADAI